MALLVHPIRNIHSPSFTGCLTALLRDLDEKVRTSICKAIGKMDIKTIVGYMDQSVLKELSTRCKDTKVKGEKHELVFGEYQAYPALTS